MPVVMLIHCIIFHKRSWNIAKLGAMTKNPPTYVHTSTRNIQAEKKTKSLVLLS